MTARVWIGCLAAYNAGRLHGRWVDVDGTTDLEAAKDDILASSAEPGAEEWFIADYEGFGGIEIGESESLATVQHYAELIEEQGEAIALFIADGHEPEDFQEAYRGVWDDEQDFTRALVDDLGLLDRADQHLASYFDYAAYARDLFIDDFWAAADSRGRLHVFDRRC